MNASETKMLARKQYFTLGSQGSAAYRESQCSQRPATDANHQIE